MGESPFNRRMPIKCVFNWRMKMVYIFSEAGETMGDAFGNDSFTSHAKALEWIANNTGKLENGEKFIIVDFANDCSHFYQARLKMTIDSIE
jgi:hypothetical protein